MGLRLSKNEVLLTVILNEEQEWDYSNQYSSPRMTFKKEDSDWLGFISSPGSLKAELFHRQSADTVLRVRIYKQKDNKWRLRSDQIYNVTSCCFRPHGWRLHEGVYKVDIEVYAGVILALHKTISFEVCKSG